MHPCNVLAFNIFQQFQLPKDRFKLHQNTPSVFVSKFSQQFQHKLNIVSNCVRMHHLASSLSTFSQQFQLSKQNIASKCTIVCPF